MRGQPLRARHSTVAGEYIRTINSVKAPHIGVIDAQISLHELPPRKKIRVRAVVGGMR